MTVGLPGLHRQSQTLKIRLLPGAPHALKLASFNDGSGEVVVDHGSLLVAVARGGEPACPLDVAHVGILVTCCFRAAVLNLSCSTDHLFKKNV